MSHRNDRILTGAQALVESLERVGVDVAFGIPGGEVLALVDALDGAFISSWQSTAAWQQQLDAAREHLHQLQEPK